MIDKLIDGFYYDKLKYKPYLGKSSSNTDIWGDEKLVDGLRLRGNISVTHSDSGDTTSCNIVYRTADKLVEKSLLNGREIIEVFPVPAFGLEAGYEVHVK